MHVVLNVESLLKSSGGIGRYTEHLLKGLLNHKEIDKVSCFGHFKWLDAAELIREQHKSETDVDADATETTEAPQKTKSKIRQWLASIPFLKKAVLRSIPYVYHTYALYNAAMFYRRTQHLGDAIYHEPNYILKPFRGKSVTTVHDLSFIHCPEYHPKERVRYLKKNLKKTLAKAAHVITDSDFVRNELIKQMNVAPERVSTVLLGVDEDFHPRTENELEPVLAHYNLKTGSYLLSVATLEPRKNISTILDVYMQLDDVIRKTHPLVLVGGDGWNNQDIKDKITELKKQNEVIHIGYVENQDLPYLFAGARAFIFIPFYEGFGLPPLEAMASGIPVLTSNVSSIPEVVGNTGVLVDPNDKEAIKQGMLKVLTDESWRTAAIKQGLQRAGTFTWTRCVEKTVAIYKQVMNS